MVEHSHLIIRAEVKQPFVDCNKIKEWLRDLVQEIGMNITDHGGPHVDYVQKEGNCGIAAVVMIETSHVAIHIWDQEDPPLVQMDVYSCSEFNEGTVIAFLSEMEPTKIEHVLLNRKSTITVASQKQEEQLQLPQTDPLGLLC